MQSNAQPIQQVFAEGMRHHQAGRLRKAEQSYRRVLAADPGHADSLNLLGVIACEAGRADAGIDLIGRAIRVNPKIAAYHFNLAIAHQDLGQLDRAVDRYRSAIALKPDHPVAHNNLGNALLDQDKFGEAEACYRLAFACKPDFQQARNNLASALRRRGRFDEAAAVYQEALKWGSDVCASYHGLSVCRKFTEADRPLIADIEAASRNRRFSDSGRSLLHFALGKIFDDLGRYEEAMGHFDQANALEGAKRRFDAPGRVELTDWLIAASPNPVPGPASSESELPVLIVGMPRSGTTLVEQILASHRDVAAGGELVFWLQRLDSVRKRQPAQLDPAAERDAVGDYLGLLRGVSSRAARVTDKMPLNFLALGHAHRLFPNARIIHCRRSPIDTALSIYFTRFAGAHDFACGRSDIVFFYREYNRLMDHWRAVLPPDRFLEIDYEDVVFDQEAISRRLVAFCGLEWDAACLHFPATSRPILTASAWQARQPLYRGSAGRWRNYEPWLGAFRELLPDSLPVPHPFLNTT